MTTTSQIANLIADHKLLSLHMLYGLGLLCSIHALFKARTPQGAIAWGMALLTMPILSIPLYLVFGRNKFHGYVRKHRERGFRSSHSRSEFLDPKGDSSDLDYHPIFEPLEKLVDMRFTENNDIRLLIDGEATYEAIYNAIDNAEKYIVVEFYTIRPDSSGNRLREAMLKQADKGATVFLLYDDIGSATLTKRFLKPLLEHPNITVKSFRTTKGRWNKFQLNFRNHRKIVIVDGKIAFTGGLNIGDEYLGKNKRLGYWRDTHCEIRGPLVRQIQVAFLSDWYWASGEIPEILDWTIDNTTDRGVKGLAVPISPADEFDTGLLYFANLINNASQRIWISTPYFVPDPTVVDALVMAALRGVEVEIIIPDKSDAEFPRLAAFSYFSELEKAGVELRMYKKGFIHQKVMLVDDDTVSIGTANFDNRSMRLNFEINILLQDKRLATEVEKMLKNDIRNSSDDAYDSLRTQGTTMKFIIAVARLFAPVL